MKDTLNTKTLFVIDANSLIHRAFHALPPFTSPDGKPTGALYGLTNILLKILKEKKPDYIVAAYDTPEPTFRDREFTEYKGTRPPIDDTLLPQLIESPKVFDLLGIKKLKAPGWEADDIIMTVATKFAREGVRVEIFSGDLDILQAVDGKNIVAEIPKKGISNSVTYDKQAVLDRFGVSPEKLADYKGLVGDTSDNIPGIKGIGPKTAAMLINKYGTLEDMYEDIETVGMDNKTLLQKLIDGKKDALMSKRLARLSREAPVDISLEELAVASFNTDALTKYLEELGFKTLVLRLNREYNQ